MGLLDLFNKEKRDLMLAKAAYDACRNERRAFLNDFRRNAFQELSFKHPDGRMLSSILHPRFMLYSSKIDKVLVGQYADQYAPSLPFVAHDARTPEWQRAVVEYRAQMAARRGVVRPDRLEKIRGLRSFLNPDLLDGFTSKGFAVTSGFDANFLVGGALFLNGEKIAASTVWRPSSPGHFADMLYRHVVATKLQTSSGFSSLVLVLGTFYPISSGSKFQYELIFGNGDDLKGNGGQSIALAGIIGLRDFIAATEHHYSNPLYEDGDKADFCRDYERSFFESPDAPDEDTSIESHYIFG